MKRRRQPCPLEAREAEASEGAAEAREGAAEAREGGVRARVGALGQPQALLQAAARSPASRGAYVRATSLHTRSEASTAEGDLAPGRRGPAAARLRTSIYVNVLIHIGVLCISLLMNMRMRQLYSNCIY